ncbi:glycine zipper 2TM domain-containing protein [Paracoccus aminophilus]|uniref:glycine zipper 2TM domain-containing protein n=1 Tax=Paracoccus aminophilus TaxID=34003 RepID=UPI002E201058
MERSTKTAWNSPESEVWFKRMKDYRCHLDFNEVKTMIKTFLTMLGAVITLAACDATPTQQAAIRCNTATLGGAAVGAGLGRQVGGGSGRNLATVAGALGGAAAGNQIGC